MASRFLKQLHVPSKPLFRSSVFPNKASPFNVHLRNGTNVTFANPQALGSHLQSMRKLNSCLDWQGKANTWRNCRQIGTTPGTPLEHEELPDPLNPHEHPLATVGYEELSEDKKYWRKRQSEAPKKVYVRQVDENGYAFAIGKRKSSVARVWIREGTGSVLINGKDWVDYFPRTDHRDQIMRPLFLIGKAGLMSIECSITGGGNTGQAEALRHGVARALLKWNPDWRKSLKKDGLLTRDSRVVESKKYGRKKARKAFQWVKR